VSGFGSIGDFIGDGWLLAGTRASGTFLLTVNHNVTRLKTGRHIGFSWPDSNSQPVGDSTLRFYEDRGDLDNLAKVGDSRSLRRRQDTAIRIDLSMNVFNLVKSIAGVPTPLRHYRRRPIA
jgi:hypothetical protein